MIDNYSYFEERERYRRLHERNKPVCAMCGEPITDDFYYEIKGDIFCHDCIEDMRMYICD